MTRLSVRKRHRAGSFAVWCVCVRAPPSEWRATEYEPTWLSEKGAPRGEDCSQPHSTAGWAVSPTPGGGGRGNMHLI